MTDAGQRTTALQRLSVFSGFLDARDKPTMPVVIKKLVITKSQ